MIAKDDRESTKLTTGQGDMEIESYNDEYCKHDPKKEDHSP